MSYERDANYYVQSGGVIGPPSAYDHCKTCHGSGEGPSGNCIHTGEFVESPCPDCGGSGKRKDAKRPHEQSEK